MLQVRRDEAVGDGAVDLRLPPSAEHDLTSVQRAKTATPGAELHLRELVGILRRRGRLVAGIAVVGTILAAIVGLLIPPKYTATAQLIIERPAVSRERVAGAGGIGESIDTHVILITSRDHLQRVIERLPQDPAFGWDVRPTAESEALPGRGDGPPSAASDEPMAPKRIFSKFKDRLEIWIRALRSRGGEEGPSVEEFERNTKAIQEGRSRVMTVAHTSASPDKAAAFVNLTVQLYVDNLVEQRLASASAEMTRLHERTAEAKSQMDRAGLDVQKAIQQRLAAGNAGPEADLQLRGLERQAATSAQLYGSLLRRQKEMRDQQENITAGVAIQSLAAVPHRPSSHNPLLFILPALFVFAIGASWLAVVLEKLDRGLRSERATADALGIPCIGLVPKLPRRQAIPPHRHLRTEPFSAYSEAIRLAAASVQLAEAACTSKVVLVSSSIPGEGKTTFAISLAGYLALLERRVLLVNFDLRQGSARQECDRGGEEKIVELDLQNQAPAKFIKRIPEVGIDYLGMPQQRLDPLALFAREQIPHLILQLRKDYDCVIIDGPPVLGIAETRLLCSMVDQLIFIVKWGSTRREVAQNALNLLRDFGFLDKQGRDRAVAILTQVELEKHARYGYGDVGEHFGKYDKRYSRSGKIMCGDEGGDRIGGRVE